jgi:hypothetical protein
MIIYGLGPGAATNPARFGGIDWTGGYTWATNYGQAFIPSPLFGHQYSHCWIDFPRVADAHMNSRNGTVPKTRAARRRPAWAYCIANPMHWTGYSGNVWD